MMWSDMKKLAFLCGAIDAKGHRVTGDADGMRGTAGPEITYGIVNAKAYLLVFGNEMTEADVATLIADLVNGVAGLQYTRWKTEQTKASVTE